MDVTDARGEETARLVQLATENLPALEAELLVRKRSKLKRYFPAEGPLRRELYPKHMKYFAAGAEHRERLFLSANRCVTPWTPMEMGRSTRRFGEMFGVPVGDVRSWDGVSRCSARSGPVFLKNIDRAFRCYLDNGQYLDATEAHRVLTVDGWRSLGQLIHRGGGLHCTDTRPSWTASYAWDVRLYGERLQMAASSGQATLLPRRDAQGLDRLSWQTGAAAYTGLRSRPRLGVDHHATGYDLSQPEALIDTWADPTHECDARWSSDVRRTLRRFVNGYVQPPASVGYGRRPDVFGAGRADRAQAVLAADSRLEPYETTFPIDGLSCVWCRPDSAKPEFGRGVPRTEMFVPYGLPRLVGGQFITGIVPIGDQPILDVTVDGTHCYESGGVINSNTGKSDAGCFETTLHATGEYPDWWIGKRFEHPIKGWVCGDTSQTTKNILQDKLLGPDEARGTGFIPPNAIYDLVPKPHGVRNAVGEVWVKHKSGGLSILQFRSYDQGRHTFQGTSQHLIHLDEEPPMDVYTECLLRTMATGDGFQGGIIYLTFTPLEGLSEVVLTFCPDGVVPEGGVVPTKE